MLNSSGTPTINHPFRAFENYRNRMLEMFQDFDSEFGGHISISGQRELFEENKNSNGFYSTRRSLASFHKSVTLPNDANEDDLKADYENEVLKITIGRLSGEWL